MVKEIVTELRPGKISDFEPPTKINFKKKKKEKRKKKKKEKEKKKKPRKVECNARLACVTGA